MVNIKIKTRDHSFEICGSNGGVAEAKSLLRCDAVSLGKHFMFQTTLETPDSDIINTPESFRTIVITLHLRRHETSEIIVTDSLSH